MPFDGFSRLKVVLTFAFRLPRAFLLSSSCHFERLYPLGTRCSRFIARFAGMLSVDSEFHNVYALMKHFGACFLLPVGFLTGDLEFSVLAMICGL